MATESTGSREADPRATDPLRELPSVEELSSRIADAPKPVAVTAAREAIAEARKAVARHGGRVDPEVLEARARAKAHSAMRPSLRRVINATGVIVHTNLGRAPLPPEARRAVAEAAGYANLEYDLEAGERGSRQSHVEQLLCGLCGAEAAMAVNNCAAAVLLGCAALAEGREVVVSRGQLVEIGGSFRIPDVAAQSGARLVEVGTTNRTRLADYAGAIGPETGAVLRAHQSNFRTLGFVEGVEIERLCGLAADRGVPVIDDVGSGALAEGFPELADEPPVRRSVAAGAALVCFSGDKLLGGPQAGLLVGREDAVERCRRHPLARAVRIGKLPLAALEATLRLYLDPGEALRRVPALRMLTASEEDLRSRAERLRELIGGSSRLVTAPAAVGGGALPLVELEGPVCAVEPGPLPLEELAGRLRAANPPVVGRAREGWLLLDPRTMDEAEIEPAAEAVRLAVGEPATSR